MTIYLFGVLVMAGRGVACVLAVVTVEDVGPPWEPSFRRGDS